MSLVCLGVLCDGVIPQTAVFNDFGPYGALFRGKRQFEESGGPGSDADDEGKRTVVAGNGDVLDALLGKGDTDDRTVAA